jgi:hypothetical protein
MVKNFDKKIGKLKRLLNEALKKRKVGKSIRLLQICAILQCENCQIYFDEELENALITLASLIPNSKGSWSCSSKNTVLFYDGFGNDVRGLAVIYLRALVHLKYKIIYVTEEKSKQQQPQITRLLKEAGAQSFYVRGGPNLQNIGELETIFNQFRPEISFFYSTPWDSAGLITFAQYQNKTNRFLINLTDHLFWLGVYDLDYDIEFRNYGAFISKKYRKIPEDKILILPYYPFLPETNSDSGLDLFFSNYRVVFSGGSLHKTDDINKTFYSIVEEILGEHPDAGFLYVGNGDTSDIRKLQSKYPNRVRYYSERSDFFDLLKKSIFFLNTYPISGGLMIQYAAKAGKIPLTLKHDDDCYGFLIDYELDHKFVFSDRKSLTDFSNRLFADPSFLEEQEGLLKSSVISESDFQSSLSLALKHKKSTFKVSFEAVDVSGMQQSFLYQFSQSTFDQCVARKDSIDLFFQFPGCFVRKILRKLKKKRKLS